jgi:hypothetical protein
MHMEQRQKWLKAASALVIGFGVLVALSALPAANGPTMLLADILFWPPDGAQSWLAAETRLVSAIGGGVMVGWGWVLWVLSGEVMARAPDLARRMILQSVGMWFVIDSTGSVAAGAPLNVLGNLAFLAAFVWPLRGWAPASAA